ncbi:MAG: phage tail protein, partial [Ilumatobacteraceae bacterium]
MPDNDFYDEAVTSATFLFEVDGVEIGRFREVSGLEVNIETEDVPEGGQNSFVHKLPGRMTWPNITLKRGVTQSDALLKWLNKSS